VLSDDRQSRLIPAGVKRAGLVLFRQEPGGFCSHLKIDLNEANFLQKNRQNTCTGRENKPSC
jgi:hypothetical protein